MNVVVARGEVAEEVGASHAIHGGGGGRRRRCAAGGGAVVEEFHLDAIHTFTGVVAAIVVGVDEDEVADVLLAQKDISPDDIMVTKLQGITAIQKLLGKKRFETLLSDLIIKPAGKPTLVDALDKRPEYGINKAIEDFKN